jgi:hypothetical protein
MYFAHRRGWNLPMERLDEKGVLPELIGRGAKYLFVNRSRGNPEPDYSIVYEDEHYTIYDLQNLNPKYLEPEPK